MLFVRNAHKTKSITLGKLLSYGATQVSNDSWFRNCPAWAWIENKRKTNWVRSHRTHSVRMPTNQLIPHTHFPLSICMNPNQIYYLFIVSHIFVHSMQMDITRWNTKLIQWWEIRLMLVYNTHKVLVLVGISKWFRVSSFIHKTTMDLIECPLCCQNIILFFFLLRIIFLKFYLPS